ncbi:MAG: N-acetylmuramoyl-L-alanine amidase family protein [Vulcanimicrobiaceae bacterium]
MSRHRTLVGAIALALFASVAAPQLGATAMLPLRGELFVVDPGHGTRRPDGRPLNVGAVAPDGTQEARIALEVGTRLAALLRADGATVRMTRTVAQPYRTATTIAGDNHARAAWANRLGATAFIAVHCDASLDRTKRGTSVFWLRPNSVALADAIRAQLAPLGLGESEFHPRHLSVTDEARVPAVLVELGFITNPAQEARLRDAAFQAREATALAQAIVDVFGAR